MILETFLAVHASDELKKENFGSTDITNATFVTLIVLYAIFTIFVAICFPIANNVLISLLLAILLTPIFWIIKIIELLAGTTLDRLNSRTRT